MPESFLTKRFQDALIFAFVLHRNQTRKGSNVPYISHLLSVAALVLEDGGDEIEAIAALLHDAVEDQGGLPVLHKIRNQFGERVAFIVEQCSDTTISSKPPWRERKQMYLHHLENAPTDVLRVSMADKLHNLRTLVLDYRKIGEQVWERFNGGKDGTLWYYQSLMDIFQRKCSSEMAYEFSRLQKEMMELVNSITDLK